MDSNFLHSNVSHHGREIEITFTLFTTTSSYPNYYDRGVIICGGTKNFPLTKTLKILFHCLSGKSEGNLRRNDGESVPVPLLWFSCLVGASGTTTWTDDLSQPATSGEVGCLDLVDLCVVDHVDD